jgi:hypothetical protein
MRDITVSADIHQIPDHIGVDPKNRAVEIPIRLP